MAETEIPRRKPPTWASPNGKIPASNLVILIFQPPLHADIDLGLVDPSGDVVSKADLLGPSLGAF